MTKHDRDPHLQNIPLRTDAAREIRDAFRAEPIDTIDWAALETRALAMMGPPPVCPMCGAPTAPDGDGALCDSFHQTCGCEPAKRGL